MRDEEQPTPCPDCPEHLGYTPAAFRLHKHLGPLMWDALALTDQQYAQITTLLAGRVPRSPFGHDSLDNYNAAHTLGVMAGLPEKWSTCPTCGGSGEIKR